MCFQKASLLNRFFALRLARVAVPVVFAVLTASGCASAGKILETVGLKTPEVSAETAKKVVTEPRKITLRIHAGEQLNTDAQTRSLSVVVRIYKLHQADAFLAAPYETFVDAQTEKTALGADLKEVREIVLRPGQKHEVVETLAADVSHVAVAALFRAPADGRWRFVFDAKRAEQTGITLGVHGCALSVAVGTPERTPAENLRLAGVQCR
jgi:type VI secretion system protein VasD